MIRFLVGLMIAVAVVMVLGYVGMVVEHFALPSHLVTFGQSCAFVVLLGCLKLIGAFFDSLFGLKGVDVQ